MLKAFYLSRLSSLSDVDADSNPFSHIIHETVLLSSSTIFLTACPSVFCQCRLRGSRIKPWTVPWETILAIPFSPLISNNPSADLEEWPLIMGIQIQLEGTTQHLSIPSYMNQPGRLGWISNGPIKADRVSTRSRDNPRISQEVSVLKEALEALE